MPDLLDVVSSATPISLPDLTAPAS